MGMQFNLLPWREAKRQEKVKRNKVILIVFSLLGFVLGGINWWWEKMVLSDYQAALSMLEQANEDISSQCHQKEQLDKLKSQLQQQMTTVQSLQVKQLVSLYLLESLKQVNTEYSYLSKVSLDGGKIVLRGLGKTDKDIAQIIEKLQKNPLYQKPHLLHITAQPYLDKIIRQFTITASLKTAFKNHTQSSILTDKEAR